MNQNYWEQLLIEWRLIGRSGFTIPFIIGSQKYCPHINEEVDIRNLFKTIIESATHPISIKYCLTNEDIVLEIFDKTKNLLGFFPSYSGQQQSNLYLTSFCSDLGNSCEEVIENLVKRYSDIIDEGKYSKNNRERGDFLPEEKTFIKKCFNC